MRRCAWRASRPSRSTSRDAQPMRVMATTSPVLSLSPLLSRSRQKLSQLYLGPRHRAQAPEVVGISPSTPRSSHSSTTPSPRAPAQRTHYPSPIAFLALVAHLRDLAHRARNPAPALATLA